MNEEILIKSYHDMIEDNKLIRLATITTIIHSIIFVLYILYQTYFVVHSLEWTSMWMENIQRYLQFLFGWNEFTIIFISVIIILVIWYFLLPPIAEASMIYYINSKEKSGTQSLTRWFLKFFAMFEFDSLISLFSFFMFFVAISRVWVMGIGDNPFILAISIMRFMIIIIVSILFPYTKFFIVLENKSVTDSVKASMNMALNNINITLRFVWISYLLYLRFFLNIIFVIWVPAVFIYIAMKFWFDKNDSLKYIIYWVICILIMLSAYINGIIEAFFTTYWYKVYQKLNNLELSPKD